MNVIVYLLYSCFFLTTGQFWGIPMKLNHLSGQNYTLTMYPPDPSKNRTVWADLSEHTWTLSQIPAIPGSQCLYVGSIQAGPSPPHFDSVIEGSWDHYLTDSLYDTTWTYSRYTADVCGGE